MARNQVDPEHIKEAHVTYLGNVHLAGKYGLHAVSTYDQKWKELDLEVDHTLPKEMKKIKLIPSELEGAVNSWYDMHEGDEFEAAKKNPWVTHGAIRKCWKNNEIGIYAKSSFNNKSSAVTTHNKIYKNTGAMKGAE